VFGNNGREVNLLQYANDTIFMGEVNVSNVFNIKVILKLFELVFRLRMNFHKSSFGRIETKIEVVEIYASMLNCKVLSFPSTYLGLPIGTNPRRVEMWQPVIQKFVKRLALWKLFQGVFDQRGAMISPIFFSILQNS